LRERRQFGSAFQAFDLLGPASFVSSTKGTNFMAERRFFLRGEIDIAAAPTLRADLDDAVASDDGDLLVDCTDLTFIDSSGLSVLLSVVRELQASGRGLRVANASNGVVRVIQVAGLTETLRVNEDPATAREATG
jgi:anti-sigma B factor antagonist